MGAPRRNGRQLARCARSRRRDQFCIRVDNDTPRGTSADVASIANEIGVNVYPLWNAGENEGPVTARRAPGHDDLAITQRHWSLEPHTPARVMTLSQLSTTSRPASKRALTLYEGNPALP